MNLEVIIINNSFVFLKARIDTKINNALKLILEKKKVSQQDFLERIIKEYVIENLNEILVDTKKENK